MTITPNSTTMMGSLPHHTAEEAYRLLQQYPLLMPAWPQLPKRSFKEAMIPQYTEGFPGIAIDEQEKRIWVQQDDELPNKMAEFYEHVIAEHAEAFAISADYAAGFHYFQQQLATANTKVPIIKGQVTGPFTFGLGLNDQDRKAVWFDEQYRDVVLKGLTMKALWQIRMLQPYAEQVVIFFDEPVLSALGTPAYMGIQDDEVIACLNEVIQAAQNAGAKVGVHCCGNMDWGLLARTALDIIAFDAYFYGDKLALYPADINAFLERGGMLASGIVPTGDPEKLRQETPDGLRKKQTELVDVFVKKGISKTLLHTQMLFTPSCGMGTLSIEESQRVLELLATFANVA